MAKRTASATRPWQKQPEYMKHICDDCKHSNWVETHQNKDLQGKYICLTCPFKKWHIIRGSRACAKFEPEPKGKEGNNE